MIVSSDKIVTSGDAIDLSGFDDITILADVEVAGDVCAVGLGSDTTDNILIINGHADAEGTGLALAYDPGYEDVSVAATGTVSGVTAGVIFYPNGSGHYTGYSASVVNAGYIYGNDAIASSANANNFENSGQIIGNVNAIDFRDEVMNLNAYIANDAPGVIHGNQNAIVGAIATINNSGQISSDTSNYFTIDLSAGVSTISSSGDISGTSGAIHFGAGYDKVSNSGAIRTGTGQAIYGVGGDDDIENSGEIASTSYVAIDLTGGSSDISSSGAISGLSGAIRIGGGEDVIRNSGVIAAVAGSAINIAGADDFIENSGKITGTDDTIALTGATGVLDGIVNDVGGDIEADGSGIAVADAAGAAHLVNHGDLDGGVVLGGGSYFANTGDYAGALDLLGGNHVVRNAGTMTFDSVGTAIYAVTMGGADLVADRFVNTADAVLDATNGYALQNAKGAFTLVNHGEIFGDLSLNSANNVEVNAGTITGDAYLASDDLVVNRGHIDGSLFFSGTGNIYRGLAGDVTGTVYGAGADGRYMGGAGDDTFDMTASGAKYVSGGAGDDTFIFTAAGLTAQTVVLGGDGVDALTFSTPGTIAPGAFAHVSGVEVVNLGLGNNSLSLTDAMVSSAAGGALTVNGNNFLDTINASAVATASDTVTMYGGLGADTMTAGGGKDVFAYHAVNESTGPNYDTVIGANFGLDRFDLSSFAKPIAAINAAVTSGSLSAATFNADLAADLPAAKLGAHDAVLFTASAGSLSGQTFLVVDVNGSAGYQANADLVIHVSGSTGSLTTASFV